MVTHSHDPLLHALSYACKFKMFFSVAVFNFQVCMQDELPTLETVEELARWNVTPAETFTLPASPLPSPSKPCDLEQPEQESREDKNTCKRCGRKFMSLKGLRSHERSHAAVAAIKKLDSLPTSALKHK